MSNDSNCCRKLEKLDAKNYFEDETVPSIHVSTADLKIHEKQDIIENTESESLKILDI